jgi:large subunit ribosomal protein L28
LSFLPHLQTANHDTEQRISMGRACDLCGRGTTFGKNRPIKGVPKKKGGVGIKKGPQTLRTFKVNLHDKRLTINGVTRRVRICGRCLKASEFQKA